LYSREYKISLFPKVFQALYLPALPTDDVFGRCFPAQNKEARQHKTINIKAPK
jgi:hypothetical protein